MSKAKKENMHDVFHQIGDHAKKRAPAFEEVWRRAEKKMHQRKIRKMYIKLAVAAAISVLICNLLFNRISSNKSSNITDVQLSAWRSPTEILMHASTILPYQKSDHLPTDLLMDMSKQITIANIDNPPVLH